MLVSPTAILLLASTAAAAGIRRASAPAQPPCDEATTALLTGIHLNIVGQYAELNSTKAIIQQETQDPTNYLEFLVLKGKLESDIQSGINIRAFNQIVAPKDNAAVPGLAKYASAQETEKNLASGLTGFYPVDKKTLDSLVTDIQNGIKLNNNNFVNATSACTLSVLFPNSTLAAS